MENKLNKIKNVGKSDFVMMGPLRLRQPIPAKNIKEVDPFILLHHYGPYEISPEKNPMDLGPHPHRGFEPVTFLIQGEQLHRDSLGNESLVKAGDVQWTTAGKGIIHAEGPSKEFVEKGGELEGIQLWLNLPASHKMMDPSYQHIKSDDFPKIVSDDGSLVLKVVAGKYHMQTGPIATQTDVNVLWGKVTIGKSTFVSIPENHKGLIYLIKGGLKVNDKELLSEGDDRMFVFGDGGEGVTLKAAAESEFLLLSGVPIDEPVVSHGPFVMNTAKEINQAMYDFQKGKMGFLL